MSPLDLPPWKERGGREERDQQMENETEGGRKSKRYGERI